jgi:hypothetical protein
MGARGLMPGTTTAMLVGLIRDAGSISTPNLSTASGVPIDQISARLTPLARRGIVGMRKVRDGSRLYNEWLAKPPQAAPEPEPPAVIRKRASKWRGQVAPPRTNPAAAAGQIIVYRPDASGQLVVVHTLPAPADAEFRDRAGEWARQHLGRTHETGGAQRGKPRETSPC